MSNQALEKHVIDKLDRDVRALVSLTDAERLKLARFARRGAVQRLRASRFNTIHYESAADDLAVIDDLIAHEGAIA